MFFFGFGLRVRIQRKSMVSGTLERYDMNGRSRSQGGKNWILPKEMNANRFFRDSHWLDIWKKPLMVLYGIEWRERGYGLQHIYQGKPYARADFIPPVRDFGFGLGNTYSSYHCMSKLFIKSGH
jgi:hypothetical protein